jgi:hypothetical protein
METQFNTFVSYNLTEEELKVGSTYNILQLAVLQNRRAELAQSLLNLVVKDGNVEEFKTAHAYLKGQMDIITWQLDIAIKIDKANKSSEPQPQEPEPSS